MNRLIKIKKYYAWGGRYFNDPFHIQVNQMSEAEIAKIPFRYDVINSILEKKDLTLYLEIGVRDPSLNFDKIKATTKYSVDPGIEFKSNPVDFKMTSDMFFEQLRAGKILEQSIKFDVIFIDGLHLAEQVDRDIKNSFEFLKPDGFLVLHDCNPPSEWHAREKHAYRLSPAGNNWNGTTWKAFVKWGQNPEIRIACVDTDWGVGILTKNHTLNASRREPSPFYAFIDFQTHKKELINLISFEDFKLLLK